MSQTMREALERAAEWISRSPHGDNCYVSDHYEGDPGNCCNCGKESLESYLEGVLSAPSSEQAQQVAELKPCRHGHIHCLACMNNRPAAAAPAEQKGLQDGRRNELRSTVHGGVPVGACADSSVSRIEAASLTDKLWNSSEVMSLNAELGLTMDQLVSLFHSMRPLIAAPAVGVTALREALQFYANGDHFLKSDPDAWDTVSGEPANLWCDEAGTATVEDGSIARAALAGAAQPRCPHCDGTGDVHSPDGQWRGVCTCPAGAAQGAEPVGIYAASRASIPERPMMWQGLRLKGWPITSTWIDEAGEGETDDLGELWRRIHAEIQRSTGVLLYAEADDFPLKGALIECGIALGMGKPVAVVLPSVHLHPRSMKPLGSWAAHPLVTRYDTLEAARQALTQPPTGTEKKE